MNILGGKNALRENKRKLPVFLFLSVLIALMVSCNQTHEKNSISQLQPTSETGKPEQTLNFRITWKTYSGRGEAIKKIVEEYNEQGQIPYQVTVTDGDEDFDAIETLVPFKTKFNGNR